MLMYLWTGSVNASQIRNVRNFSFLCAVVWKTESFDSLLTVQDPILGLGHRRRIQSQAHLFRIYKLASL